MFSYIATLGAVHLHTQHTFIYPGAALLTLEEFEELNDKAMEEQFGSLIIDCSHKDKQFLCWLDTELIINKIYAYIKNEITKI